MITFSNLTLKGSIQFVENMAFNGGAIALFLPSKLNLIPSTNVSFILNYAYYTGGALHVEDDVNMHCSDSDIPITNECFISIRGYATDLTNISLFFVNNSAAYNGSTIYGGELNKCRLWFTTNDDTDQCGNRVHGTYSDNALQAFLHISKIHKYPPTSLNISSPGQQIRVCHGYEKTKIHDDDPSVIYEVNVHPGGQFYIPVTAVGQANSAVPAKLLHVPTSPLTKYLQFRLSPESQNLDNICTNASFRLYSTNVSKRHGVRFKLFPNSDCLSITPTRTLSIFILPCPLGFILTKQQQKCSCDVRISKFTSECYIDNISIGRMYNNFWISKDCNDTIILHEFRCPLDYCKSDLVNTTLESPSKQCDFNRNGTLCGRCKTNFSLALGSLHCLPCSNNYIALLIPFALAGAFLIAILSILHLTVASGTLSGLIFYANIIQANHQVFFPRATANLATHFISWLNLDLGMETCFYDGMDIYAYSWLQFLFPFYIWSIICAIILISRYSKTFAKILGHNPVAVLATLLLLSYSKILKAIIVPLSWTSLTYYNTTDEYHHKVWLYDGSVGFFQEPKHATLGLFAIITLIVFVLPYIFLLLCGHWLQGFSNWWALSWLNKIKPIMDAYYAPYKKETRYWIGLLLLSRLGLFLTFAINTLGSATINILAVSTVAAALLALQSRIYERRFNDILESISLLNLCIFSIATFYLKKGDHDDGGKSQLYLSSISVAIAFLSFIVILLYHLILRIRSTNVWNDNCKPFIHNQTHGRHLIRNLVTDINTDTQANSDNDNVCATPTSTVVDIRLREPLIELNEAK